MRALVLVAPALVLLILFFVLPIVTTLYRSIQNHEVARALPNLARAIRAWDGAGTPGDDVQAALALDLRRAFAERGLGAAGRRLNMEIPGYLTLLQATGRRLMQPENASIADAAGLARLDTRWSEPRYWAALRRASATWTDYYFLTAVDLQRDDADAIVQMDEDRRLYLEVMGRSIAIGLAVTALCLAIAYPISVLIVGLPTGYANIALTLVLLPFWTSILVRTAAWMVLLQREGLINSALMGMKILTAPQALIFNRFGVLVALSHVLLPYMILTLYAVMKRIDPQYVRAARALGAAPFQAFWRVYLPQTLPGVAAGCLLVFVLAVGSYVTPALVGGRHDQMISYFIAYNVNQSVNWGLASALSVFLLAMVLTFYPVYLRFAGASRMQVG